MREAQKPDHLSLNSLLGRLKDGRYLVPDFQRDFEWRSRDIRDLTRSIFLDYYIGSLLLWRGTPDHYRDLACQPLYGIGEGNPEYVVLDGQQRLTAIHYAFVAPDLKLPTRAKRALYFIRIDRLAAERWDEAFDFSYSTPGRGAGVTGFDRAFGDRERQYDGHIFPLAVVGAGGFELFKWVQGYSDHWRRRADAATDERDRTLADEHVRYAGEFGDLLRATVEAFQVSYIELDRRLEIAKVCDIFTQINSKGVRLDVFDLLNALLKPKGVQLRTELWRRAEPRLSFVESAKLNVYVLQVMSILGQTYSSPQYLYFLIPGAERKVRNPDGSFDRQTLVPDAADFTRRWDTAVTALERAIDRLRHPHEFGVSKPGYLPYLAILPVFAAALATVREEPAVTRLAAERRFRLWYWSAVFTNRYSASSETMAARDIQDLRLWFRDEEAEPEVVSQFRARVSALDLHTRTKKGEAVYNGIFNLLVIAGARDWVDGSIPRADDLDDHHIVPKSWGSRHLPGNAIDTILNRTALTGATNRHVIGDRLPNAYLPGLIEANGRAAIETLMATHFVSPACLDILLRDPFGADDFQAFIAERQRAVTAAIRTLVIGGRADLPVDIRTLDEEIDRVERALRALVAERLDDDPALWPTHLRAKLDGPIARERRRHPGTDERRFDKLSAALEFSLLTDLLDAMVSKPLASRFAATFPSKEMLIAKFGQLGELRNSIRHSRSVGDVVRKEGEAALLWFRQALQIR